MSLAPISPLITDWIKNGLKWKYVWQPTYRPFTIPANSEVRLPREDFIFTAPEGLLLVLAGLFDHPQCGIGMENPQIDTGNEFAVSSLMASGTYNQPWHVFGVVPPKTAPGTFGVGNYKEWAWTDWCKLYVINVDNVPHTCYGFTYIMALLLKPRPPRASDTALKLMLARELYDIDDELRRKLTLGDVNKLITDMSLAFSREVAE